MVRRPLEREAAWTRDIEASGWVDIDPPALPGADGARHRVERVPLGPERDAVIRSTAVQQPFPADLLYGAAQRHIAAVGVYVRLIPVAAAAD